MKKLIILIVVLGVVGCVDAKFDLALESLDKTITETAYSNASLGYAYAKAGKSREELFNVIESVWGKREPTK